MNTKELDQTLGWHFPHQPSERGAGAPLACPDTDLASLSVFQKTQRPSHNNSIEERTRNTLIVSYCKTSLLFSVFSWEAWKLASCMAGSSEEPQGKQHEHTRCFQNLCTPQAPEIFVCRPDKKIQHYVTQFLQQLPTHHLYPKFTFTKDFFFHGKFYRLQVSRRFLFAFVHPSSSALAFFL